MVVIVGCIIAKDNKLLMVQEASQDCYGLWTFPAGHLDEPEKITDAAIREVYEETGCKVKLTGVLPIKLITKNDGTQRLHIRFVAEVLEESSNFNKEEILDVKWIDIKEVKNMTSKELRSHDLSIQQLEDLENNKIYPLDIFDETNV